MKPTLVISCPASSRSGYGDHARDIIKSLIKMDKFDIKVLDQRWGQCPRTELTEGDDIQKLVIPPGTQIPSQPDVWIQVTVANEFIKMGKYNIGITAGIETDRCSPEFLQGCNNMDLIIVPSEFSKQVLESTAYDGKDQNGNKATLKLNKPVEVVLEGLDINVFKKTSEKEPLVEELMSSVNSDYCFLFVGHWLQGAVGHDRKDISTMIDVFNKTFKNKSKKNQPALILKTGMAGFSRVDEHQLRRRVLSLTGTDGPEIKIIHGDLTPSELNALYNHPKIKTMVSFTKGEGFGRPLLEFGMTGKPILASNWSGHVDFLGEYGTLLPGEIKDVHQTCFVDKLIIQGSKWFYINPNTASSYMKSVYKDYKVFLENARKQPSYIKKNFTLEHADDIYRKVIDKYVPEFPTSIKLKLPKLKQPKMEKV